MNDDKLKSLNDRIESIIEQTIVHNSRCVFSLSFLQPSRYQSPFAKVNDTCTSCISPRELNIDRAARQTPQVYLYWSLCESFKRGAWQCPRSLSLLSFLSYSLFLALIFTTWDRCALAQWDPRGSSSFIVNDSKKKWQWKIKTAVVYEEFSSKSHNTWTLAFVILRSIYLIISAQQKHIGNLFDWYFFRSRFISHWEIRKKDRRKEHTWTWSSCFYLRRERITRNNNRKNDEF